ncbi:MAG TPA: CAP domain-containing protein [Bacteroidota bacterium]
MRKRALYCLSVVVLTGCSGAVQQMPARSGALHAIERRTHDLVNAHRVTLGEKPLLWSDAIAERALIHSQNMAMNKFPLSHRGFEARVKEIARRIPYNNSAENVAMNWGFLDPASKFVEGWLASPGHLENIEGNYTMTGIGVALSADSTYYATQIFILAR